MIFSFKYGRCTITTLPRRGVSFRAIVEIRTVYYHYSFSSGFIQHNIVTLTVLIFPVAATVTVTRVDMMSLPLLVAAAAADGDDDDLVDERRKV